MILTLEDAKKANPNITQLDLDAFEAMVRTYTHNNFQVKGARFPISAIKDGALQVSKMPAWLKVSDTLQVSESGLNNGVYTVQSIDGVNISVTDENALRDEKTPKAFASLVAYPNDIRQMALSVFAYQNTAGGHIGIKSQTISRKSVSYYDTSLQEMEEGVPAYLIEGLKKYRKVAWK